jgi:hypothetical protein
MGQMAKKANPPAKKRLKNTSKNAVWIPAGIKDPPTAEEAAKLGMANVTRGLMQPGETVECTEVEARVALKYGQGNLELVK